MSHGENIWTRWGRYTNDAAIQAAPNHDKIVLNFSGRTMFAVHPVPARYLKPLIQEERRMLRQHLDYLLRHGAKNDFEQAVSKTLTNLNTLDNTGRPRVVRFNNKVEFDDASRCRASSPDDRPGEGFFNDPIPPASSGAGLPRSNIPPAPRQPQFIKTQCPIITIGCQKTEPRRHD
ncbi:hypothetical protein PMIN04_003525 [Paraphaeosphaeria minitans]